MADLSKEGPLTRSDWETCERGDLMLRISARRGVDLQKFIGAKAECAALEIGWLRDGRFIGALQTANRFAVGDATREELDAAYAATVAAVGDVRQDMALYPAAEAVTDALHCTSFHTAYWVSKYGPKVRGGAVPARKAGRMRRLKECADIVRKWIKFEDLGVDNG